jgi:hypothetical protein
MVAASPPDWWKKVGLKSPSEEALKQADALAQHLVPVVVGPPAMKYPWEWEGAMSEWKGKWAEAGWTDFSAKPVTSYSVTSPAAALLEAGLDWLNHVATFEPVDETHYLHTPGMPMVRVDTLIDHDPLGMRICYTAIMGGTALRTQALVGGTYFSYPEYLTRVHQVLLKEIIAKIEEAATALKELSGTVVSIKGEIADLKKTLAEYGLFETTPPSHERRARALREQAPGLNEWVKFPCTCGEVRNQIWQIIQHLNDGHHPDTRNKDTWTRERIADWLETLDVDLTIHTKEEA